MSQTALALPAATGTAIQVTQEGSWLDPTTVRDTLAQWKLNGLPREVTDQARSHGLTEQALTAIETLVGQVSIEAILTPIPEQLAAMNRAMENLAAAARTQGVQMQ